MQMLIGLVIGVVLGGSLMSGLFHFVFVEAAELAAYFNGYDTGVREARSSVINLHQHERWLTRVDKKRQIS